MKKSASEDQTLNKSAFDDQNLSHLMRKDQGDFDGTPLTSEPTLSHEYLNSIFFIVSAEMQTDSSSYSKGISNKLSTSITIRRNISTTIFKILKDSIMLILNDSFPSLFMELKT